jgi:glycerol-3-phosphate dehydrogenase
MPISSSKDDGLSRHQALEQIQAESDFDVGILGGGINGACLYDVLCRRGYRVLLVDKADFASGTSQASGMLIWGGLLYLRNLDFLSVFQLSIDRDRMIREMPSRISPRLMRYLPSVGRGRSRFLVQAGLWLYWMMGLGNRCPPASETTFDEMELVRPDVVRGSLTYEEAFLDCSDARFVFRWIAPHRLPGHVALNYCAVSGEYAEADKNWHLDLEDMLSGKHYGARTRLVVNCAGVWTDQVNAEFGIRSPFRHALSKGVYLGVPRPLEHQSSLIFELNEHDDVITFLPWGPVSLWGPTETQVTSLSEGLMADGGDVDYLLEHYRRRFRRPLGREDIISIRCGIRPLVVDRDFDQKCYPLDLSRRQKVVRDSGRPWISCYGGKLTGCTRMASRVLRLVSKTIPPTGETGVPDDGWDRDLESTNFPGLADPIPSAAWCAKRELCCTLEDYLRRRTNIAQWVPRQGLGKNDEHVPVLRKFALHLAGGDRPLAEKLFERYRQNVVNTIDLLLAEDSSEAHEVGGLYSIQS